ncbi:MAG: hypothetical protein JWQ25_1203 [Daejeonella sp.]|nr:hypothetical protein [Daejeonella sp.]
MKKQPFIAIVLPILFLMACSSNKSENASSDVYSESADSVSVTGLHGDSIKLVKTANLDFKVKDVYDASLTITASARNLGGMITHHNIVTEVQQNKELSISADSLLLITAYQTKGDIIAKIPTNQLDEFMAEVYGLSSFINTSNLDVDDRSLQYLESDLKQKSRAKILADVNLKDTDIKGTEQLINQHDDLINKNIANRQIIADTRYSTVQLTLSQNPSIKKEKAVNDNLSSYQIPTNKRIVDAFLAGWEYFMDLIIALMHLWMFIVLGLAIWLIFRMYKRKKGSTLEAKLV